jgi:transcriptional regulator with AAA-type ATPase domain
VSAAVHEGLSGVIADSPAMKELLGVAARLAEAKSPVLIQGESGTGKDLLAHWLHYKGTRRDGPFIKVHCPSIPEDLLESELFGHERGAFTDARQAKAGKIELAAGGTLFFDQIEDLSLALQAKLLRVVEEKRFERLGGTRTFEIDVRFVSASRIDLRKAVTTGTFRDDLYHRLSVVPLTLPLRERPGHPAAGEAFLARERERHATQARPSPKRLRPPLGAIPGPHAREPRAVERRPLYSPADGGPRRAAAPGPGAAGHAVGGQGAASRSATRRPTSVTCSSRSRATRPRPRPSSASAARRCGRSAGVTGFPRARSE